MKKRCQDVDNQSTETKNFRVGNENTTPTDGKSGGVFYDKVSQVLKYFKNENGILYGLNGLLKTVFLKSFIQTFLKNI